MGKKQIEFDQVVTRGGDHGESSLYDGRRYRKDEIYFDVLGSIDEVSAFIGLARAELAVGKHDKDYKTLVEIQRVLLWLGAEVATNPSSEFYSSVKPIQQKDIDRLEKAIAKMLKEHPLGPVFVLRGGDNKVCAYLDVCSVVCRRAERSIVALIRNRGKSELALCQNYLNRLSDYFFTIARKHETSPGEVNKL